MIYFWLYFVLLCVRVYVWGGYISLSIICISSGMMCGLPPTTFTLHHHFCVGFLSLHTCKWGWDQLMWPSETCEVQQESETHSTYTLFGCMIYELCPRVAAFIFLLLTAPLLRRLGPLWDEGKEKPDFLTLEYIKQARMSSSFSLWWSWDGVSKFDVSKSTHCLLLL